MIAKRVEILKISTNLNEMFNTTMVPLSTLEYEEVNPKRRTFG